MKKISVLLVLMMFAFGCGTARQRIVVGNASEEQIGAITVVAGGKVIYQEASINPRSSGRCIEFPYTPYDTARVSWKSKREGAYEDVVPVKPEDETLFNGTLYIQLSSTPEAKTFFLNDEEVKTSVLPWTMPEEWEGTPSIPGMNTGQ